jgi:hypothetical protein
VTFCVGLHVDQLYPYRRTLVKFLSPIRNPSANWLALVEPFSLDVWLALAAVVVASAVCLFFAHWKETGLKDISAGCLVALGVFAQQGDVPKVSKNISFKSAHFSFLLVDMQ